MPLSDADRAVIADMRQRELNAKGRQRATDAIHYELRRFTWIVVVLAGLAGALLGAGIFAAVNGTLPDRPGSERLLVLNIILGLVLGLVVGRAVMHSDWGRRLVADQRARLVRKYASDLYAGRRWADFYYADEEISAYIPQILYSVEGEHRFDSVAAALAFAKLTPAPNTPFAAHALDTFNRVAAQTNTLVVSSVDRAGRPTSRMMAFVRSDRPGVWYVTAAPQAHRVHEFDRGQIAVITAPTDAGGVISSNRVEITRAPFGFAAIAELYRAQLPGHVDLSSDEQQRDLVYQVTLRSARVDTWSERDVVNFGDPAADQGSAE